VPLFDSLCMVSYSTSLATMTVSRTVSETHRLMVKTRMMGLSGDERISTKHLAVLIQSTRVTHRQTDTQTDGNAIASPVKI